METPPAATRTFSLVQPKVDQAPHCLRPVDLVPLGEGIDAGDRRGLHADDDVRILSRRRPASLFMCSTY
jgi:hypothetical protein